MSQNKQKGYLAPEVEVMEVAIECGFSLSDVNSTQESFEEIGNTKQEIGW